MPINLSVLVVEDEPLIAMLLIDMLEELGCTVAAQASSVAEGLERVADTSFDTAILDINLRGQPVWPVADALRHRGVRFVLATGYEDGRSRARFPEAIFMAKPYAMPHLQTALDDLKAV